MECYRLYFIFTLYSNLLQNNSFDKKEVMFISLNKNVIFKILQVNEKALKCAEKVLEASIPSPTHKTATVSELQSGLEYETEKNKNNLR